MLDHDQIKTKGKAKYLKDSFMTDLLLKSCVPSSKRMTGIGSESAVQVFVFLLKLPTRG